MSDDFQNELTFLGIESSPAFVREPEGNGCIERFFSAQGATAMGPAFEGYRYWLQEAFAPLQPSSLSVLASSLRFKRLALQPAA